MKAWGGGVLLQNMWCPHNDDKCTERSKIKSRDKNDRYAFDFFPIEFLSNRGKDRKGKLISIEYYEEGKNLT